MFQTSNLYGVQPFYMNVEQSNSAHGVLFMNANAQGTVSNLFCASKPASVAQCEACRREPDYNAPGCVFVFVSRLCHSGQTHRFRHCSVAAVGAFEYPKTNSRNSNKEELYFTLFYLSSFDSPIAVSLAHVCTVKPVVKTTCVKRAHFQTPESALLHCCLSLLRDHSFPVLMLHLVF